MTNTPDQQTPSDAAERPAVAAGTTAAAAPPAAPRQPHARGLGLWQVISSVAAAGLGVQSSRNRERDFEQGRMGTFVVAGLLFTALFIGGVLLVVRLVLSAASG